MKAGIIGGGMIGAGWARLLQAHGHAVRIYDERPALCLGAASVAEAATGADLVIEAVAERADVKRIVLTAAGAVAPADALIASASSSILPSRLQEGVLHPERVLVIHPLHPVELLPVIEVVPGAATAPAAVERAAALVTSLGKQPVILRREVAGYVINRLAAALWREAINLVLTGVVDVPQLDLAASRGPCLGWAVQGPFLTYQLAAPGGLGDFMAHLHPAFQAIWASLAGFEQLEPGQLERIAAEAAEAYGAGPRAALEEERDRRLNAVIAALAQETAPAT
jgi:3-hydroxyacyl-CoA dehydrogenase